MGGVSATGPILNETSFECAGTFGWKGVKKDEHINSNGLLQRMTWVFTQHVLVVCENFLNA